MKESIKKRIEAVRRGEVPEGYVSENHQLRPVDWRYEKIGKYLVPHDEFSNNTEAYPLATSSRQGLMLQSEYYSDQRYEETSGGFHVVPEGYVTYRHMSDDDIFRFNVNKMGTPVLVSPEYPVFTAAAGLDQNLLMAYLNNMKEFTAYCSAQKKGSTRTRMYFSRLGEFAMPIPPVLEQQKIAEILATCDRVIELKQQLLEEKRRQKQWLMQKLLDPNSGVRLPGFAGSIWKVCCLGDIADIYSGGTPDTENEGFWNGNILWCTPSDITNTGKYIERTEVTISEAGLQKSSAVLLPVGAVLMCSRATIGPRTIAKVPITTNQGFKNFVCKENLDNEFLYYALDTVLPDLLKKAAGNTFKEVSKSDIANSKILVPGLDEQKAIACRLATADMELDLFEQELAAWQQKKKALMQLLLTGLVRVNA